MHKSQVFFMILLGFLTGVLAASLIQVSQEIVLGFLALGVLVLAVSAYHKTFGAGTAGVRRRKVGFVIGATIIAAVGGMMRYQQFDVDHSRLTQFNDRQVAGKNILVSVRGYVDGDSAPRGSSVQFPFRVKEIYVFDRKLFTDERVLVTVPVQSIQYGDVLLIQGAPRAPQGTGDFDYALYLKKQGIRTTMQTPELIPSDQPLQLSVFEQANLSLHRALSQLKNRFLGSLTQSIAQPHASYIAGILLGVRQTLPDSLVEAFQRTGTTHILAISGFNITIIAEAIMWVMLFFVRRRKAFWWTVLVIALFTLLTGASASVVRAAIMGTLVLFARGYGRLYDAKIAIALAAALMVLANPFILAFDVGFQLSFLAVLGLIYVFPVLQSLIRLPALAGLSELFLMTVAVQITTLPLIIGVFHTVPVLTLPANILILPFIPYTMLAGFVAGIMGMLWLPLGRIVGALAWALAQEQVGVVRYLSSHSFATMTIQISWWILLAFYAIIAWIVYRLSRKYDIV